MRISGKVRLLWFGIFSLAGAISIFVGSWFVAITYVLFFRDWPILIELFESGRGSGVVNSFFPDWSGDWAGDSKSALIWLSLFFWALSMYLLGQVALKLWRHIVVNKWKTLTYDEARWFELAFVAWYHLRRHERIELRELEKRLGLPSSLPDHLHDEP